MDTDLKGIIKAKGWSYRKLAKLLRVSYQYLSDVANGHRKSKRLENEIRFLLPYELFIKANPNFFPTNKKQRKIR